MIETKRFCEMTPEEKKEYYRRKSLERYYGNKELAATQSKKWREDNKDYIRTYQRNQKRERKLKSIDYLGGVCQKCNQSFHPSVYEFHHKNPDEKDRDPSKMLSLKWEKLILELDKCILLCANCHRITHNNWE